MSEKLSLHKQSLHTFRKSIKDELLKRVGFSLLLMKFAKLKAYTYRKRL